GGASHRQLVVGMYAAIVIASLAVDGLFSLLGLVPSERPSVDSITERAVTWNYTSFLDIAAVVVFVGLIALTFRRGAVDPVCGMSVDGSGPASTWHGRTFHFCGPGCKARFDADPEAFSSRSRGAASAHPTSRG